MDKHLPFIIFILTLILLLTGCFPPAPQAIEKVTPTNVVVSSSYVEQASETVTTEGILPLTQTQTITATEHVKKTATITKRAYHPSDTPTIPATVTPMLTESNNISEGYCKDKMSVDTFSQSLYFLAEWDGNRDLYSISAGGGAPERMIEDVISSPVFSPDGTEMLLYRDKEKIITSILYLLELNTGTEKEILIDQSYHFINSYPIWSTNSKKFALTVQDDDGYLYVYIFDASGNPIDILLKVNRTNGGWIKSWFPDGKSLLMTVTLDDKQLITRLAVANLDTHVIKIFESDFVEEHTAQWNPIEDKIIYIGENFGETPSQIYMLDIDGEKRTQVTNDRTIKQNVRWSPAGDLAFYVSVDQENYVDHPEPLNYYLKIVDVGKAEEETLLKSPDVIDSQDWSPDGRLISYTLQENNTTNLYVLDVCTQKHTLLVENMLWGWNVTWKP